MDRSRHQMACPGCRGSGRQDCQRCDGMGTRRTLSLLGQRSSRVCTVCDGTGRIPCRFPGGIQWTG